MGKWLWLYQKFRKLDSDGAVKKFFLIRRSTIAITMIFLVFWLFYYPSLTEFMPLLLRIFAVLLFPFGIYVFFLTNKVIPAWSWFAVMSLFYIDCDLYKYADIIQKIRKKNINKKADTSFILYYTECCFYMGRTDEAYRNLKLITMKQKHLMPELLRLQLWTRYYVMQGDIVKLHEMRTTVENLPKKYKISAAAKNSIELSLEGIDSIIYLHDGNEEMGRIGLENILKRTGVTLYKVQINMVLAQLDIEHGDKQNAKSKLNYVIQNGNKMREVEEAKRVLKICSIHKEEEEL